MQDNDEIAKRVREQDEMLDRMIEELDIDGDDHISKKEFVNAYLRKHRQLEIQKIKLREDLKDLETEK